MSAGRRAALIYRLDLGRNLSRPLFWILILILGLTAWGLSSGSVTISSGNSAVGGTKAWITSEFANGKMLAMVIFLFYSFFIAVAAGMSVMQDEELKVGEVLHATPLRPREYIWGKFLAIATAFVIVLGIHLILTIFFNHILPNTKAVEVRGPFALMNYLRPALVLGLPSMLFIAGTTFAIGERTRKPILVFVLPVAAVLLSGFFLWSWTPSWLDPRMNRILMLVDPAGVRWLSETWLKVDRGVDFYNKEAIRFDLPFILSRIGFVAIGLVSVLAADRRFGATLRGAADRKKSLRGFMQGREAGRAEEVAAALAPPLAGLAMRADPPRLLRGIADVVRFELKELRGQPGLYLFVPMILLQTLGTALVAVGVFDTPVLLTSGQIAARTMNTLTLLVCLLTLFYTVESLRRERNTGMAAVFYATPVRTASILFGKTLANSLIGILILLGTLVGGVIALLIQGKVGLDMGPFAIVWGLLLVPTFLAWTAFVMFVFALTGNRYTSYGIGLAVLALTGYLQVTGKMSWAGNWDLWGVVLWSDMGVLELNRAPLLLSRIAALGLCVFFTAFTVRIFPRHDRDATRTLHRLEPHALFRGALRLAPYAAVPLVALIILAVEANQGFQGKAEEKKHKDYWKQNLATWKDAPLPAIARADVDLDLEPARRSFKVHGSYALVNRTERLLRQVPLTGGTHWEDVAWTMNGSDYKPEDRSRLYVFTPPAPLNPGDSLRIGFAYHGVFPKGITKNGGGTSEFILPSGVVLTSFRPSFVPVLGFLEDVGVDDKNRYEPRVYPDDFYEGVTKPALGSGPPFPTRIRISAPEAYTLNSVGAKTSESVGAGRRTVVWESDEPVRFFNVVAAKWKVRPGEGTAVFYHPSHAYNIEEITDGLDAARRYYSEWFLSFPWKELKLSEFPAHAYYAQGFPTNITFSEGIGFLTQSDPKTNTAFLVTAHESAHQWWGNMLTPGEGPGGDILSEGMAHFSTILLMEQVKGIRARIEFCKRIEERYGNERQVDSERPMTKIDGSRTGDTTVIYDKGGWVFWMLLNLMGRTAALEGLQSFIREYKDGPDYPVLQDFVTAMRPFAPDTAAYNDFVDQWFFHVVVPEYKLSGAKLAERPEEEWDATVHVRNAGTGRMPVEIGAVAGERFGKDGATSSTYRDARATVTLDAGGEEDVTIRCEFKPERVLVDPDARVLQLERKAAVARF